LKAANKNLETTNMIIKENISEIRALHASIMSAAKRSLDEAIRVGELLENCKTALPHGEWLGWVRDNLSFSERTARNYLRLFRNRDVLKSANVADLSEAYVLLAEGPTRGPLMEFEIGLTDHAVASFCATIRALLEIRDSRLFEPLYPTFEDYCRGRWHFDKRAFEMLDFGERYFGGLAFETDGVTETTQG
jgi:hypothetical protein